jgi:predicted CDP-diglyceride synthetase/phosphatidate cytidylyltransferase|tara:strand:- start:591 stop:1034 length:444 start_codon:yes stop_codon:yes gene_type:complete
MSKNGFQNRWKKLIAFDDIRKYKIIEMFQYTFILFAISLIVATLLNHTYYTYVQQNNEKEERSRKKSFWGAIKLIFILFLETVVLTLLVFYMRKIAMLVPSYGSSKNTSFVPFTTLHYVTEFTLLFAFIEMLPEYRYQFVRLGEFLS